MMNTAAHMYVCMWFMMTKQLVVLLLTAKDDCEEVLSVSNATWPRSDYHQC